MEGQLKFLGYFARKNSLVYIKPTKPTETRKAYETVIYLMSLDE